MNALVGFDILSGHIEAKGVRDGFRACNGSGPAAEAYATDAMKRLQVWRQRITGPPIEADARPTLREGDTGPAVATLQKLLNKTFPAYSRLDLVPGRYGPQTVKDLPSSGGARGVSGAGVSTGGRLVSLPTWAALEHFGYR